MIRSDSTYSESENVFLSSLGNFEEQSKISVSWYDFGARNYDPSLGMWFNVDPMLERYHTFSPYHFTANDPVNNREIDGMQFSQSQAWIDTWREHFDSFGSGDGGGHTGGGGSGGGNYADISWRHNPNYDPYEAEIHASYERNTAYNNPTNETTAEKGKWVKNPFAWFGKFWAKLMGKNQGFYGGDIWISVSSNSGADMFIESYRNPKIYIDIWDLPEGFSTERYSSLLKKRLVENGFNKNIEIDFNRSIRDQISDWWNNKAVAYVRIVNFQPYIHRDHADAGGYGPMNSNSAFIYNGLSPRREARNTELPIWMYVNVTLHELGHGIFGFTHVQDGSIMEYSTNIYTDPHINFNSKHLEIIRNSNWGN